LGSRAAEWLAGPMPSSAPGTRKRNDGTIKSESEKIVAEHDFLDIYIYITDIVPKYLTKDKTCFGG